MWVAMKRSHVFRNMPLMDHSREKSRPKTWLDVVSRKVLDSDALDLAWDATLSAGNAAAVALA